MAALEPLSQGQLPIAYAECARDSVLATFSAICGGELVYEGYGHQAGKPSDCIVGIISIVGGVAWSVMLNFPRETATTMALRFAGFEIPYESEDMGDVIGELANVLAGDLCAQLDAKGVRGDMSLPTVVRASDMSLMLPEGLPSVEMHFSSPVGQFSLKLAAGDPRSLMGRKPGS